jgi:hypothetical protein
MTLELKLKDVSGSTTVTLHNDLAWLYLRRWRSIRFPETRIEKIASFDQMLQKRSFGIHHLR